MNSDAPYKTIDEYIQQFPHDIQVRLKTIRDLIKENAPDATETINYGMPTFQQNGNLVHFAAAKNHIGFYPTPSAIVEFQQELEGFTFSKGAVQFPLDKPMPLELVKKMTRFRVKQNLEKKKK